MGYDTKSFKTGLALGLTGKPLPIKKEPVAYLYNGVRLPKLPEWDKEKYPYAVIWQTPFDPSFNTVRLCVLPNIEYTSTDTNWVVSVPVDHLFSGCEAGGEWLDLRTNDSLVAVAVEYILWVNFDVRNEDGTVYLAASEPTPVYE